MKRNIYTEITEKIVAQLESAGKWEQGWSCLGAGRLPGNIASGKAYRGINVLALWSAEAPSQWWGTYQQWQAVGGQVRKGEKSSTVVFFSPVTKRGTTSTEDTPAETFPVLKYFSVFHAGQVDGDVKLPFEAPATEPEERIADAEAFFAGLGGTVNHGGDRAYYSPSADRIQMPRYEQFREAPGYYSTLAHEYIHWTAPKQRLGRELGKRFGDEQYAMEELVAELGAAFTLGTLELAAEPRVDHAQYLASWIRVLKADHKAIFHAAGKAQAAVEYLAGLAGPAVEEELAA